MSYTYGMHELNTMIVIPLSKGDIMSCTYGMHELNTMIVIPSSKGDICHIHMACMNLTLNK